MGEFETNVFFKFPNRKLIKMVRLYSQDGKSAPCSPVADVDFYRYTLCSEKNTHSHFLSYIHELFVDLNKNCSEYTQGLVDSNNVKIRYSLRSMT